MQEIEKVKITTEFIFFTVYFNIFFNICHFSNILFYNLLAFKNYLKAKTKYIF